MLKSLRTELDMEGKLDVKVLDDGDAVGVWYNADLLVALFPTGDTLPEVRLSRLLLQRTSFIVCLIVNGADGGCTLTAHGAVMQIQRLAEGKKLVLMINPQWTGGQVVSDFGFFGRQKKEDFVKTFDTTYSLQTKRMCGEDIRYVAALCHRHRTSHLQDPAHWQLLPAGSEPRLEASPSAGRCAYKTEHRCLYGRCPGSRWWVSTPRCRRTPSWRTSWPPGRAPLLRCPLPSACKLRWRSTPTLSSSLRHPSDLCFALGGSVTQSCHE